MREITRRLSVSKSSVSLWVRDLPLTAEQRARLEAENALHGRQLRGAAENARKSRLARIRWQDEGWDRARNGDPLFAAGCSSTGARDGKRAMRRKSRTPIPRSWVHRTRIVQTNYGGIQEYGGFERPEWLD